MTQRMGLGAALLGVSLGISLSIAVGAGLLVALACTVVGLLLLVA